MPPLTPRTPIVVFGDDWGRHVSTMQHLFRHLNERYPVLWVNAIGHRPPTVSLADARRVVNKLKDLAGRGRRAAAAPRAASAFSGGRDPLEVIHPRVLPWHQFALNRAVNRRSLVGAIRGALARHGLTERPMLVTGTPPSVCVLGELGEAASLYLCMDDFLHLPEASAEMLGPLEEALLARIGATVATARALVDLKRPRSGRSHYLPQGVNYDHFATRRPVPREIAALPRPIIGFAGGVGAALDFEIVRRLSEAFPAASVVLVGPIASDPPGIRRPNVHLLGPRPYDELPSYVQAFDVGTIPYLLNAHTVSVDPLKLLEYLAAGIPVVATDLAEVRKYADAIAIGAEPDAFIAAVRRQLEAPTGSREARQALARAHRWEARARELEGIIADLMARAD